MIARCWYFPSTYVTQVGRLVDTLWTRWHVALRSFEELMWLRRHRELTVLEH